MVQQVDALGRVITYNRDPLTNLAVKKTDRAGRVWQFTYNQRGDLIRTIDPQGNQTLVEYDLRFRKPVRIENALGNVVTMAYDDNANLVRATNAELETTTFTYTPKGQLATVTDPLNRTARFTYDANGNLVGMTNAAGADLTRVYDGANRLIQVVDPINRASSFTYDSLDRVTQVQDAAMGLTFYTYDANDNVTSVNDPNGNAVERNIYDLRDRLAQKTDAKNLTTIYTYDSVGNLTSSKDRNGQVTTYAYDVVNRMTQALDADGRSTVYGYDLADNITRMSDSDSGDTLMSYDSLDRLTEIVTSQGTVSYAYDAIGRRTSRTLSGGDVTTYTYDKANRVKSVTLRGRTTTYSYDAAARLTRKILPDGIQITYTYDDVNRLTSISYAKSDGTAIETVNYAYDAAGQRISKATGSPSRQETPIAATYDEANRLTSIVMNGETFSLSYDANGNLVSKSGPVSGTTGYSWDARGRLAAINGPAVAATFRYDAIGRRIERTVNGVTTGYLYDGAQAVAELKGNAVDTAYHTGLAIDEVLARYGISDNQTLLADALGSVIAQAADDQSVQTFRSYSPYGETTVLGQDDGNSLQYSGRENDQTGLYFYRARYYDPVLKRFISEDPIGLLAGTNYYAYVSGNPVSLTDASGLIPNCIKLSTERLEYSYEKEITDSWSIIVPVPMGTHPEPDFSPPKRGKVKGVPSPGWELQLWEIGWIEYTSYLVETTIKHTIETCSEWRTIKDPCGGEKPWFYFNEREWDERTKNKMPWGKWKEWYEHLILKPRF
jgi:RHS repeat-associated protein